MADETRIHSCDSTVNPVMGCDGCELCSDVRESCYAWFLHQRHGKTNPGYATDFNRVERFPGRMAKAAKLSDLTGRPRRHKPWLDGCPRIIFISDMGDALNMTVSFEYLEAEIIDTVTSAFGRRHVWLWLTKRPERMAEFSAWLGDWGVTWPTNLWAGTTVTTQATTSRLDHLANVGQDSTAKLVSVEPQLDLVDLGLHLSGLDWVIQGGESGRGNDPKTGPRPFDVAWARQLRDQCHEAGVAYFLKQLGARPRVDGEPLGLNDRHNSDWDEWPEDLCVREVPTVLVPDHGQRPEASAATTPEPASSKARRG